MGLLDDQGPAMGGDSGHGVGPGEAFPDEVEPAQDLDLACVGDTANEGDAAAGQRQPQASSAIGKGRQTEVGGDGTESFSMLGQPRSGEAGAVGLHVELAMGLVVMVIFSKFFFEYMPAKPGIDVRGKGALRILHNPV